MDKKVTSIVAYSSILVGLLGLLNGLLGGLCMFLPLIIWFVAYSIGDKNGAKLHLNQSFIVVVLGLACGLVCMVLGLIPIIDIIAMVIDWIVRIASFIFSIWGIYIAVKGEDKKFPVIGDIIIFK